MTEATETAVDNTPVKVEINPDDFSPVSMINDPKIFDQIQRVAKMYSASEWVPPHYRNNLANTIIAVNMACSIGVNPIMFLQRTYPVHGRIGFEGQLASALVNTKGGYAHELVYEYEGEGEMRKCTCWTKTKDGVKCEATYALSDAKKAGIDKGNSWKVTPLDQKLAYMAALMFVRRYCSHLTLGMPCVDEIQIDDTTSVQDLKVKLKEKAS